MRDWVSQFYVAEAAGLSRKTINRYVADGVIVGVERGHIPIHSAREFLESRAEEHRRRAAVLEDAVDALAERARKLDREADRPGTGNGGLDRKHEKK